MGRSRFPCNIRSLNIRQEKLLMQSQDGKNYNPWAGYGQSKTANNLTALELARRLKSKNIQSYSLHPGGKSHSSPYLPFSISSPHQHFNNLHSHHGHKPRNPPHQRPLRGLKYATPSPLTHLKTQESQLIRPSLLQKRKTRNRASTTGRFE